ncbi:IclR family transcriptional regulator [Variovorax saccharolyticus]|uniref:IclR family transcriptional regulator n=1 Tax=Variovorax saccharolyticus TaxID=3053516 RepID=UPI002577D646|nr:MULTISPECIES: helix-turn-helix domain-containing protein [unclassified Variovorax]MDM0018468.1 helix-turn-helix domain-containing protein [Variovorax sp. J22R187]MDM0024340.1 helix-turn-helix domain-containing protein [Variovorax sp. J31P216]
MTALKPASRATPPVRGAQSIDRAMLLLQTIAAQHARGVALPELVEAAQLDRTTTYRIVSSLVRAGLVSRDADTGAYRLGIEAMALGLTAMQRAPLIERCLPAMKALARRSQEHVFLVVRSGDYSHCLHMEQGVHPIRSFFETVGSMRLLGLGIPSFSLLARMSDDEIAAHHARHLAEYQTHNLSAAKLQRWIRQTRELGHAQIVAKGIAGVGMRFAMGSCGDAALGIVVPASRMPRSRGAVLATMLRGEIGRLG